MFQAANAVSTVANKLGKSMDPVQRNALIQILLNGLTGRTWNGKDKLLNALASICTNCKLVYGFLDIWFLTEVYYF